MRLFALLFLICPLLELAVLIKVGSAIGVLATFALLALGAVLGILVIRLGGLATAFKARERLAQGQLPNDEMIGGLLIAVAGGLLLLPGLISDALALVLLVPWVRQRLIGKVTAKAHAQAERQRAYAEAMQHPEQGAQPQVRNVIEGEYKRHDQ